MQISSGYEGKEIAIRQLFVSTFTQSEGAEEGQLIGGLVRDLLRETPKKDIRVFCAYRENRIIGAAIFSRLTYIEDSKVVFILSPMSVAADCQGQGVGQALIRSALDCLKKESVDIAITYGDPNYYGRVGFLPIQQEQARPPLPLSMPHGWVGQSLNGSDMPNLLGPSTCVPALDRSDVW